jgi:hypothetical protein
VLSSVRGSTSFPRRVTSDSVFTDFIGFLPCLALTLVTVCDIIQYRSVTPLHLSLQVVVAILFSTLRLMLRPCLVCSLLFSGEASHWSYYLPRFEKHYATVCMRGLTMGGLEYLQNFQLKVSVIAEINHMPVAWIDAHRAAEPCFALCHWH